MTTSLKQTRTKRFKMWSTLEDRSKRLGLSSRKLSEGERVDSLWLHQQTWMSTLSGTQATSIIWLRQANLRKMSFHLAWTFARTRIPHSSMRKTPGAYQDPNAFLRVTNIHKLNRSSMRLTKPSQTSLKISTLRKMLERLCTWYAQMMSMKKSVGWRTCEATEPQENPLP